jgi:hypothetical protein
MGNKAGNTVSLRRQFSRDPGCSMLCAIACASSTTVCERNARICNGFGVSFCFMTDGIHVIKERRPQ